MKSPPERAPLKIASIHMWKTNWDLTTRRFIKWWNREGLVLGAWSAVDTGRAQHEHFPAPPGPATLERRYCDPVFRAAENHYRLSRSIFPLDELPLACTDLGPGSLALFLGSEPEFDEQTVWYHTALADDSDLSRPLRFDPSNRWWRVSEAIVRQCAAAARGKYIVGFPDLIENMDILASLRGAETLCMDLIERPEWIEQKLQEINQAWFEAYTRIYDIIKLDDGSSAYGPFAVWGPGKVAKVQCDCSAMFSPDMFASMVVPALSAQCEWLDHSLYHLDGTQAIGHLDALLGIDALDAIEWTPQAGLEPGGHPRWYELYRRILRGGKSVQVMGVQPCEIRPLLDAIGNQGVYIIAGINDEADAELMLEQAGGYYS